MIAWLAAYIGKPLATWFVDAAAKYIRDELRAWKLERETQEARDKVFEHIKNAKTLEETDAALRAHSDAWNRIRR